MERSLKRPYQPSITSYFGHTVTCNDDKAQQPLEQSTLSPSLPTTIQASLLNVGMRVRKAVPEGYRRRSKDVVGPGETNSVKTTTGFTGLVPYCGLLKIGGHTAHPAPDIEHLPELAFNGEDLQSDFPSSQESCASTTSSLGTTVFPDSIHVGYWQGNKRRREDADKEDFNGEAQPVSPRCKPVSHTRMPNLDHLRAIAVPKSRKPKCGNVELREREMTDAGDFEEAPFLRPTVGNQEWGDHMRYL